MHLFDIEEIDEVEDAVSQEGVGQLLLVVRRDDCYWTFVSDDFIAGFENRGD